MSYKLVKFTSESGKVIYERVAVYDPYVEKKTNKIRVILIKCPLPGMTEDDIIQIKKDLKKSKARLAEWARNNPKD
jgi:hypothetical protein